MNEDKREASAMYLLFISLFMIGFVPSTNASKTANIGSLRVQRQWPMDNFCFRRFNNTHEVGCSSSFNGNIGWIHLFSPGNISEQISDLRDSPYIPYINDTDLSTELLDIFAVSGKVVGVLVNRTGSPKVFSSEDSCPNRHSSYAENAQCDWNDDAENPMLRAAHKKYPFPIFLLAEEGISREIIDCYKKYNVEGLEAVSPKRRCSLKLFAPMNGVKNSKFCRKRTMEQVSAQYPIEFCEPFEDANVLVLIRRPEKSSTSVAPKSSGKGDPSQHSTIVLACRMDAFSMFSGLVPGANTAVGNIVTLLTVARSLHQMSTKFGIKKNVLITLFNGEALDYIGSSRFVSDLRRGRVDYGLRLTNISSVIELNQLFLMSKQSKWYAHVDSAQMKNEKMDTLRTLVKHITEDGNVEVKEDKVLPPASVHSILRVDRGIPVVVITNHKEKYTNKFYNSIYDDYASINATGQDQAANIFKLTVTLLKAFNGILMNGTAPNVEEYIDKGMIKGLMDCFLTSPNCSEFAEVIDDYNEGLLRDLSYPLSIDVGQFPVKMNPTTILTYLLLARHTGKVIPNIESLDDCVKLEKQGERLEYRWMNGKNNSGICVVHDISLTLARSPAFDNDYSVEDDKYHYSTWTKSGWKHAEMSLFVEASDRSVTVSLISGSLMFGISLLVVIIVKRDAKQIFDDFDPIPC